MRAGRYFWQALIIFYLRNYLFISNFTVMDLFAINAYPIGSGLKIKTSSR